MKRLSIIFTSLLLLFSVWAPLITVHSATANLVNNPSVETINPTNSNLPKNWTKSRSGTNTGSLRYDTTGHTGSRSLYAQLKTYVSGEAKWSFKHLAVSPSKTYVFSDYFKSNAPTKVFVETKSTANVISRYQLGSLPANSDWTQSTFEYTTPANIKSLTVQHTLSQVGWLSTDDYSLSLKETAPPAPTVSISAPGNAATVSGSATLSATATNAIGVQFSVNGSNLGNEVTNTPYSTVWDTNTTTNGLYTVTATVRNSQGLTATSSIQVTVNNIVVPDPPVDPGINLIANPSFETDNAGQPASWLSNAWGSNTTTHSYLSTGRTGNRSVRTEIANYTSGDAKWYFAPVASKANHRYTFSTYYKSNVTSRIVTVSYDSAGNPTYNEIDSSVGAATDWTLLTESFTVPANSATVSVFHLIDRVGWLEVDDANLVDNDLPVTDTGLPLNASLENAAGARPDKWGYSSWGTNTPNFEYMNEGHTGTRSAKVTVSNYVDGDAKWMFNPVSLPTNKQYRFTTWYKTNTTPHAVAMFTKADGSVKYFGMPNPEPNGSANWQLYSDTFTMPADAVTVTVFLFVSSNGYVQTDDYNITTYQPTGFNRPLLTLTFDDGQEDNVSTALPMLNQYGFKTTHCFATDHVEGNASNTQAVKDFYDTGHEVCSHTVTHPFLTSISGSSLTTELSHSQNVLEGVIGKAVPNFASPYGDYNATVNDEIKKFYRSHRTVDEGFNSRDNFNQYRLRVQNMTPTTTMAELQTWVQRAQVDNTWLVLVYHRIANDPGPYDCTITQFAQHLAYFQSSGIAVKTMNDALDETMAQL